MGNTDESKSIQVVLDSSRYVGDISKTDRIEATIPAPSPDNASDAIPLLATTVGILANEMRNLRTPEKGSPLTDDMIDELIRQLDKPRDRRKSRREIIREFLNATS